MLVEHALRSPFLALSGSLWNFPSGEKSSCRFSTFHFPSLEVEMLFVPVICACSSNTRTLVRAPGTRGELQASLFSMWEDFICLQRIFKSSSHIARVCSHKRLAGGSSVPGGIHPPSDCIVSQPPEPGARVCMCTREASSDGGLCVPLPNYAFWEDVMMITCCRLWSEYLHHRNWQMWPIRDFFSRASCRNIYQHATVYTSFWELSVLPLIRCTTL